jgi:hypothetical protein
MCHLFRLFRRGEEIQIPDSVIEKQFNLIAFHDPQGGQLVESTVHQGAFRTEKGKNTDDNNRAKPKCQEVKDEFLAQ